MFPLDAAALVAKLDLETKVRMISGAAVWTTRPVPEIGLRALALSDGPVGVRGIAEDERDTSAALPSPSGLAATWDEDLLRRIGDLLAGEAVRKGVDVVLGPTINLHRSPLGGRRPGSALDRPVRVLAGFAVVRAEPGEAIDVPVAVDPRALRHWDATGQRWAVEPGRLDLYAGRSAGDVPLRLTLELPA